MDEVALRRGIAAQRKAIYTFLHQRCPERVRNGSHKQAVAFKEWCTDAQRAMNRQLPINEVTLKQLEDLSSRYLQFCA